MLHGVTACSNALVHLARHAEMVCAAAEGSMMTAGMVKGCVTLVNELRLDTESRGIKSSKFCLRRGMEFAMLSLAPGREQWCSATR
jgi:hypothetical protein